MRFATLYLLFLTSTAALAVDYGQLYESVDKEKAAESVDTQKTEPEDKTLSKRGSDKAKPRAPRRLAAGLTCNR